MKAAKPKSLQTFLTPIYAFSAIVRKMNKRSVEDLSFIDWYTFNVDDSIVYRLHRKELSVDVIIHEKIPDDPNRFFRVEFWPINLWHKHMTKGTRQKRLS